MSGRVKVFRKKDSRVEAPTSSLPAFEPGKNYKRKWLHDNYGGQTSCGISTPQNQNFIFLFSYNHDRYDNRWTKDGNFIYAGEGDGTFTRGNRALKFSSKALLLFFAVNNKQGIVCFVGYFDYVRYKLIKASGRHRRGVQFHLKPRRKSTIPDFVIKRMKEARAERLKKMEYKVPGVAESVLQQIWDINILKTNVKDEPDETRPKEPEQQVVQLNESEKKASYINLVSDEDEDDLNMEILEKREKKSYVQLDLVSDDEDEENEHQHVDEHNGHDDQDVIEIDTDINYEHNFTDETNSRTTVNNNNIDDHQNNVMDVDYQGERGFLEEEEEDAEGVTLEGLDTMEEEENSDERNRFQIVERQEEVPPPPRYDFEGLEEMNNEDDGHQNYEAVALSSVQRIIVPGIILSKKVIRKKGQTNKRKKTNSSQNNDNNQRSKKRRRLTQNIQLTPGITITTRKEPSLPVVKQEEQEDEHVSFANFLQPNF